MYVIIYIYVCMCVCVCLPVCQQKIVPGFLNSGRIIAFLISALGFFYRLKKIWVANSLSIPRKYRNFSQFRPVGYLHQVLCKVKLAREKINDCINAVIQIHKYNQQTIIPMYKILLINHICDHKSNELLNLWHYMTSETKSKTYVSFAR